MKKEVKSYISFTRTERFGLIGLLSLLALLTLIRYSLPYFIQPKEDKQKNEALVAAWERFKELHPDNSPQHVLTWLGMELPFYFHIKFE